MPRGSIRRWTRDDGVHLSTADAVQNFARFWDRREPARRPKPKGHPRRSGVDEDGHEDEDEEDEEEEEDGEEDESDEDEDEYASANADSVPSSPTAGPSRSSSPDSIADAPPPEPDADTDTATPSAPPHLRSLHLAIPPSQLTPSFPTHALTRILAAASASLTHLRIAHTESLLAHDPSIGRALGAFRHVTHLSMADVGPRACELVRGLPCRLEEAELDFDDGWVAAVALGSAAGSTSLSAQQSTSTAGVAAAAQGTLVPSLPNGESSGLPTPAPTPATTPACPLPLAGMLPDPVPLLAHSMATLRVLRASNAALVTVADTLRFPAVRELRLRIAGVPTVTPLVHAFPALAELYVYTPYDGCGVRAAVPGAMLSEMDGPAAGGGRPRGLSTGKDGPVRPPPLPAMEATREANRTSQLYSSFPPLARVSGFAPGLYALGLTCPVRHLEIGAVAPRLGKPGMGMEEVEMVRRVLADTTPTSVGMGLGRGWWAQEVTPEGRKRRERGREALRTLFEPGDEAAGSGGTGWAGVKALVVRIEEAGRWSDVTRDLAATLKPLAGTLTTFVLRWDRTSVPFDRVPPDDDRDSDDADAETPRASMPTPQSRTETFARRLAEALPALRYVCTEIVHDASAPRSPFAALQQQHQQPQQQPPSPGSIWSAEAQNGVAEAVKGKLSPPAASPAATPLVQEQTQVDVRFAQAVGGRTERRFWRVERPPGERWLCLDPLDEEKGRKVLAAEELSFQDEVRY
ncbi:hypothetical protein OH77DRAFT_1068399 [Trametes cingulata]|nr:hypothetical protein OH77DRAFT_1068399 [Trametes cingulata]